MHNQGGDLVHRDIAIVGAKSNNHLFGFDLICKN